MKEGQFALYIRNHSSIMRAASDREKARNEIAAFKQDHGVADKHPYDTKESAEAARAAIPCGHPYDIGILQQGPAIYF